MRLFKFVRRPFQRIRQETNHRDGIFAQVESSDVMLTSFPRSGNTWFRYLLGDVILQAIGIQTDTQLPVDIEHLVPALGKIKSIRADALPENWPLSMRVLKTHQPFHPKMKRAILLYRDAADALCSYFHYHLRYDTLKPIAAKGIDAFCQEHLARWIKHQASYLDAVENRRCELIAISYESLQASPVEELQRVCRFMQLETNRTICDSSVRHHAFLMHQRNEQNASTEDPSRPAFFRQGTVGAARDELSTAVYNAIQHDARPLYLRAMTLNHESRAA